MDIISRGEVNRAKWSLFFIQSFSTLGYAILYSTLVLYMTKRLQMDAGVATAVMGSFAAFNYGLHFLGGYMSGRFISNRQLFVIGQLLQLAACFVIAQCTEFTLFLGLSMFLTGCGLNVTCVNNMVTQLFEPDDPRRESAFLWNYSGMNIGFFLGFMVSGYFELTQNYAALFSFGGLGNVVAVAGAIFSWKYLRDRDTYLTDKPIQERGKQLWKAYLIIAVLFGALMVLLRHSDLSSYLIMGIGFAMWVITLIIAFSRPSLKEKSRMIVFFILTMASLIFWALYQLAPMALTLFAANNVNMVVQLFGKVFEIAPQWLQNVNTIIIVFGAPFMAWLLTKLRGKGINVTNPVLFVLSLACIGLGFVILPIGIGLADPTTGLVAVHWMFWSYALQSVGELCISPIGYAMVGKMVPKKLQGFMMGIWMMTSGVAAVGSNYISQWAVAGNDGLQDALITNAGYAHVFNKIGWVSIGAAVVLMLLVPLLNRMTENHEQPVG